MRFNLNHKRLLRLPATVGGKSDSVFLIIPDGISRDELMDTLGQLFKNEPQPVMQPLEKPQDADGYDPLWSRYYC